MTCVSVKVNRETAHLFDASGLAVPRLRRDRQERDE